MKDGASVLAKLLEEIERLQKAERILTQVWIEMGAYDQGKLSNETWFALRDFFKFNDSE